MRIDLLPGRDCMISEIFGSLRDLKTLGPMETYLALIKVRLNPVATPLDNPKRVSASDELLADLESDLSAILTPYLSVRITYKHSGFPDKLPTPLGAETGISAISTRLQSEATAVIQRTNLQSQWSPRTSGAVNGPSNINPLIKLIETHFPTDKARNAVRRLANDTVRIPLARRFNNASEPVGSSEETMRPNRASSLAARLDPTTPVNLAATSIDGAADSPEDQIEGHAKASQDPARKIWNQIRRTSRSSKHSRSSTSNTVRTDDLDDSPKRSNSDAAVDDERTRIKQTALRNKRSLGADSLRSMAPSITSTHSRGGGSSTGVGLSMSSRWGWGGSWW
jgi:hypothetical protein